MPKVATIPTQNWYSDYYKIAAAITLLFVVGFGIYFVGFQNDGSENLAFTEINTLKGEVREVQLADGTKVWLNENSQFRFPQNFDGETRNVELEGEAFFEVAKNPNKPFIISAAETKTEVLGTSFNLSTKNAQVELALMTGKVAFSSPLGTTLEVLPSELLVYNQGSKMLSKNPITINDFAVWRNNTIVFKDASLQEVAKTLEKYYHKKITFENSEMEDIYFTAVCEGKSFKEIVTLIEITTGLTSYEKEDVIFLEKK